MLERYNLGLMGMELRKDGMFVLFHEHNQAIKEWEDASNGNRAMAESILKDQDEEIALKNKQIIELSDKLLSQEMKNGE